MPFIDIIAKNILFFLVFIEIYLFLHKQGVSFIKEKGILVEHRNNLPYSEFTFRIENRFRQGRYI